MNGIVITTTEDLQRLFREAVVDIVRQDLPTLVREANRKSHLTQKEVMDLTGWSGRKLQYLRATKQIDFFQDGRKILYPTKELYEFLDARRVRSRATKQEDQ